MMKTIEYMYYKFYRAHLKGSLNDIAPFAAIVSLSLAFFANVFIIGVFLRKIDLLPIFFSKKRQVIFFMACLVIFNYFIFLNNKRYKAIIAKCEQESESQRKKGNFIVWLYVIISFLLIFVVAFYKPGKL